MVFRLGTIGGGKQNMSCDHKITSTIQYPQGKKIVSCLDCGIIFDEVEETNLNQNNESKI